MWPKCHSRVRSFLLFVGEERTNMAAPRRGQTQSAQNNDQINKTKTKKREKKQTNEKTKQKQKRKNKQTKRTSVA